MDSSSEPPVSLAESPQLVFVYIGLSYTFEMIPNCAAEIVGSIVSLTDAACFLPTAFIDRIEKEWEVIKKVFALSEKEDLPEFVKVARCIFVYCFAKHVTMSSVTLTNVFRSNIQVTTTIGPLRPCTLASHHSHDGLEPFFTANPALLYRYDNILTSCAHDERGTEVRGYKAELTKAMGGDKTRHQNTPFHCSGLPESTNWSLSEDDWTTRLYYCLPT